ncbi:MAG: hypothetical protein M3346_04040, partial [Actinomycetota bacterium]|nr:hypothetical protein [Actinomycetota bacterium]
MLLLSDQLSDIKELLPEWPVLAYRVISGGLKETGTQELIESHPDLLLIDGTGDVQAAEDTTRRLSLAWETGLPPIVVVVNEAHVASFRFEIGADDFLLVDASQDEISARLAFAARRAGFGEDVGVIKVGELTVNPDNYQTYVRGRPLD